MKTGYRHLLRVTTGCLAVTICLQTAAYAGSGNTYSYYGKDVTADDIVTRFVGDCSTSDDAARCGDAIGTSVARGAFPFRSRGIRLHGQETKQLEAQNFARKPVKVSRTDADRNTGSSTEGDSRQRKEKSGDCPNTDASVALPINFALNSAILEAEAYSKLRQMAQAMKSSALGSCKFSVEGHTDASGGADLNFHLSKQRAYAVREFLVSMEIEPSRLLPVGKGEAEPLSGRDPLAPENRRVQFRMVQN